MRQAAKLLLGKHDFYAFGANHGQGMEKENPVKDLRRLDVRRRGKRITIIAESSGFLYKMVRRLVGGLLRVGEGKMTPERLLAYRKEACHHLGGADRSRSRALHGESLL
jgi:tRNA pseudouridine38-40 synthase